MFTRKNLILWLLIVVSAANSIQNAAAVPQTRSPNGNQIRFELELNNIFFKARLNNSKPLWFLLDTGAAASIIDARVAAGLHLKSSGDAALLGGGGTVKSGVFQGATITIGKQAIKHQTLIIAPLTELPSLVGHPVDGIIGHTLLQNFVLDIDYSSRFFELHDPKRYQSPNTAEIIPIEIHENAPMITGELVLSQTEAINGRFIIDTGSTSTFWLSRKFVAANNLLARVQAKSIPRFGAGLGGESKVIHARVSTARLAKLELTAPTIRLSQEQAGVYATMTDAGTIGGEILRRFRMVLDYPRRQLVLKPNRNFRDAFEEDMSGLDLAGTAFKAFRVLQVTPNTPAAEAGLRKDDRITAVNDRRASGFSLDQIIRLLRQPDRTIKLKVIRGKERLQVAIKLRRLV